MKIFIVQHGEAVSGDVDPEKPLSETGRKQAKKLGLFLKKIAVVPDFILHSTKKRAIETATIIQGIIGRIPIEQRDYLNPKDSPEQLIEELKGLEKSVMVVGHMPFLKVLTAQLLGTEDMEIVDFNNASPLILSRIEDGCKIFLYIQTQLIETPNQASIL